MEALSFAGPPRALSGVSEQVVARIGSARPSRSCHSEPARLALCVLPQGERGAMATIWHGREWQDYCMMGSAARVGDSWSQAASAT